MNEIELARRAIEARLVAEGWVMRHGGSHDVFRHPDRSDKIVVPRHRTLSLGVARNIAKQAGWIK